MDAYHLIEEFDIPNQPESFGTDNFSFSSENGLFDLNEIHHAKIEAGLLSLHPINWLKEQRIGVFNSLLRGFHLYSNTKAIIQDVDILSPYKSIDFNITKEHRRTNAKGIYLVSFNLANAYFSSFPSMENAEQYLQDEIELLNATAKLEVVTPVGSIDAITESTIIEIKKLSSWKQGMGQLLAYSVFYPNHEKELKIFGKPKRIRNSYITKVCKNFDIECTYRQIQC